MKRIVNIAAYKFVTLDALPQRRAALKEICQRLELKGSILLSPEGINLFLAGTRAAIDAFLAGLRDQPEFTGLEVKESLSDYQPFTRMLVRLKREIIAFGVDSIDPRAKTSPRLAATELKRWLDEGRPVTLLDTRNDYEVKVGTFVNALPIGVDDFRGFPAAVSRLPDELKRRPVVTFCTGGIRCEKAAPYLEQAGFGEVYQLDGGILKYFEECGGAHFQGECFVFDQRVALDPALNETATAQCFACLEPLTREDLESDRYRPGVSCPHCYQSAGEANAALLRRRQAALREVVTPLPGSLPYENRRPINVPERAAGQPVIDFLEGLKTVQSRADWLAVIAAGQLVCDDQPVTAEQRVKPGQRLVQIIPHTVEPPVDAGIQVLFEDDDIVVLNKPAPLPMHPCGRFNRNSLQWILESAFHPLHPRPVHRLDANTTGVVVCAKTRRVAAQLQPQFEQGTVTKRYLARVHGHPPLDEFESTAAISREPTTTGARLIDPDGLPAQTRFKVVRREHDGTAVLEVAPLTGRTNQIRLHLWDSGFPIVGDPLYLPGHQLGEKQTLAPEDPPMHLHASLIEFDHPADSRRVSFNTPCAWR